MLKLINYILASLVIFIAKKLKYKPDEILKMVKDA